MKDFQVMKRFKSSNSLDKDFPDDFLLEEVSCLLILANFLEHIPIVSIFHHDTIHWLRDNRFTRDSMKARQRRLLCMRLRSCV